ncbi:MAG: polysaccharide biosynthesis tyrosine autokinase [Bacteroidetes bacterium]|nr:polysaccharide biosynthesis tyrosine autokinase [Bacteroidota bacterium]
MKTHQNRAAGPDGPRERGIQEYFAMMIRGKWIIGVTFLAVLIATILFTKLTPPTYHATAKVLLSAGEGRGALFLDAVRTDGVKNVIQNELEILNSRALMDSAGAALLRMKYLDDAKGELMPLVLPSPDDPTKPEFAPLPLVSGRIAGSVEFDPVRDSDIITITAKSQNPREAALLANTFAEAYRDRNIYMSRAKSRSFREFLEAQAREKRKALEETENSLQNYMENQGVVSLDDESKRMIDQLAELEAARDATDINLKEMQNTLASYHAQLPQQETNVARVVGEANDTYIRQMQEQLSRLEVQRDMAVVQNPSSAGREILNEKVKEIDQQIASVRLKLQTRTDDYLRTLTPSQGAGADAAEYLKSVKQKILETEISVSALAAKKKALSEAISDYERKFDRIPSKSVALARLQRARLSNEKLYLMVEEKYNEANITEQSNIGYIEIIERAAVPLSPSSPKTFVNLALGIVLGLGLGVAIAFAKEFLDVRVQSPEDLKRYGFPSLTPIGNIDNEIERLGGPKIAARDKAVDAHLVTLSFPFSSIAESYRQMRTNLQFAKIGRPIRSVLVTSPSPGEGKSTTASNLGIAFAQTGKRVLLVDADLRRPTLGTMFRITGGAGLSELLSGKERVRNVIRETKVENLHFVSSGEIPPNPAEVLGSDAMRDFIDSMTKEYDLVLFDSSPVLAVTDPAVISTMVDGTILVAAAGKVRLQDLQQASEVLEGVGGKVAGVVLNGFDAQKAYGLSFRRGGKHGRLGYGTSYYRSKSPGDGAGTEAGAKGKSPTAVA